MSIVYDLDINEYHSQTQRWSHSRFRDFVEKGARYVFEKYVLKTLEDKPTEAMLEGRALEAWIQEGDAAFEACIFIQHHKGNTKEGKAPLAAAKAAGKLPISPKTYEQFKLVRASIYDNADAMQLIEPALTQVTLTGDAWGLPMQARPDWINFEGLAVTDYEPFTVDMKTCDRMNGFDSKAYFLGYHTQAALVRMMMRANGYPRSQHYLLVAEKSGGCRSQLRRIPEEILDYGDRYFEKHAPDLVACIRTNTWPRALPPADLTIPHLRKSQDALPTDELDEVDDEASDQSEGEES